uniref:Uncharacterized protein n=1 Tax=Zooxanthella nutricula TaxID=1333877 RepID=A0A6U8U991_9DINO
MDKEAIRQVKRLLGGQDASDVAGWGHDVDDTFPGLARMHFQVHDDSSAQPWCGPAAERIAKCDDNICLLTSIKHFYGKVLRDEGRRIDFPDVDYGKAAKGVTFSDADAVKMLINLIGDLHQPLHVGYASDDNGHTTQVRFRGKQMSLYAFWDKGIGEMVREYEGYMWDGGWTHVRAIGDEHERDKKLWKEEGAFKSFDRWMDETVQFACEKAYVHPTTGQKLGGPGVSHDHVVDIDEGAFQEWRNAWLRQILLAGERTAIVLNDILDASGATRLHEGSGVTTDEEKKKQVEYAELEKERQARRKTEARKKGVLPTFQMSVFLTNLVIALVTVPLFFVFVNHGLNPKVHMALIKSLLEGGDAAGSGASGGGPGKNDKRLQ